MSTTILDLTVAEQRAELGHALTRLAQASVTTPFAPIRMEYVAEVARRLGRIPDRRPEVQALAFWMRRAAISRMAAEFTRANMKHATSKTFPRGTILHIPPRNVDTLFAYSWVLSILTGNRNIVRLSPQASDQTLGILTTFLDVAKDMPEIAAGTLIVRFDRDAEILTALSAACDLRVIWGGDETVRAIRAIPLPPLARDLAFPDRRSMAAIEVTAYEQLDEAQRTELAERFFNDAFWFDQLGCSSPRIVAWVGTEQDEHPERDFFQRLAAVAEAKHYEPDASVAMRKLAGAMERLIDTHVARLTWLSNAVVVVDTGKEPDRGQGSTFVGAGSFESIRLASLTHLLPIITREVQTLAVFGFEEAQLSSLLDAGIGRGIDRIVAIGQALAFDRIWDGMDLLTEFTRKTTINLTDGLP